MNTVRAHGTELAAWKDRQLMCPDSYRGRLCKPIKINAVKNRDTQNYAILK